MLTIIIFYINIFHNFIPNFFKRFGKGKGKAHPITGHEGPEGEYRYSFAVSFTSELDGGGRSTPRPGRFNLGKDPVPIL
jgi:hypothetical protein